MAHAIGLGLLVCQASPMSEFQRGNLQHLHTWQQNNELMKNVQMAYFLINAKWLN